MQQAKNATGLSKGRPPPKRKRTAKQLGKRYGEQFQMSYITRDMDAAIAHCRSALGIETFHQTDTEAQVLSGGRMQTLVIRAAMANIGRQQFELIQPVSGPIHVYTDAVDLDAHIINFHHTAIAVRGDGVADGRHPCRQPHGGVHLCRYPAAARPLYLILVVARNARRPARLPRSRRLRHGRAGH